MSTKAVICLFELGDSCWLLAGIWLPADILGSSRLGHPVICQSTVSCALIGHFKHLPWENVSQNVPTLCHQQFFWLPLHCASLLELMVQIQSFYSRLPHHVWFRVTFQLSKLLTHQRVKIKCFWIPASDLYWSLKNTVAVIRSWGILGMIVCFKNANHFALYWWHVLDSSSEYHHQHAYLLAINGILAIL